MHILAKAGMLGVGVAAAAVEGGSAAALAAGFTLDPEKIIGWGTVIGMVAGGIWYIEGRVKSHLEDHTEDDKLRHEAIRKEIKAARNEQRASILHLRDLLAVAGVIPEHTPAPFRLPDEPPETDPNATPGG